MPVLEKLATYRNLGGVLAACVGPGPAPGSERLYQSYIYTAASLEIVATDPDTGAVHVFASPVPSEYGAWGLTVGPDGNLYVGTLPNAHLFRLDPRRGTLEDVGRPSESEQYIWQLAVGADGKVYGCTYPSAKLVRFDPKTGRTDDLGRLDATELYARHVAASDDGFVFIGIGTSRAQIVAFHSESGTPRPLLPEQYQVTGTGLVRRGANGTVYGQVGGQHFWLDGWTATPIAADAVVAPEPANRLRDGRLVEISGGMVRVRDPRSGRETAQPFQYGGSAVRVFRLGWGPDDTLYGSGVLPAHFFRLRPADGQVEHVGQIGGGEVYSFLQHGDRLLAAAYSGLAPLMSYDPAKPFAPDAAPDGNPLLVHYAGENSGWRPMAMIASPDGKVYLGAVSGYGELGGPLTVWDPATDQVESFHHLVRDQSVVTLAFAGELLVGGTTTGGGGGSHPTQTEAKLFLWDPRTHQKLYETVPVAGVSSLNDLVTAPNGRVFGVAGGDTLFVFDPEQRRVLHTATLPFRATVANSMAVGPDGRLWGLAASGVFRIDPETYAAALVAPAPAPITAGMALHGRDLYFAAGAEIYRYALTVG